MAVIRNVLITILFLIELCGATFSVPISTLEDILPEINSLLSRAPTGDERTDLFVSVVRSLLPADQKLINLIGKSVIATVRLSEIDRLLSEASSGAASSNFRVQPSAFALGAIDRYETNGKNETLALIETFISQNPKQVEALRSVVWTRAGDHANLIMARKVQRGQLNKLFERIKRLWDKHQNLRILYLLATMDPKKGSKDHTLDGQVAWQDWLRDKDPTVVLEKFDEMVSQGFSTKSIRASFANLQAKISEAYPDPLLSSFEVQKALECIQESVKYTGRLTTTPFIE
jgi:hypothetical protein